MSMTPAEMISKLNYMKAEASRLEALIQQRYSRTARSVNGALVVEEGEVTQYHQAIDQLTATYQSILAYEEMVDSFNQEHTIDHPRLGKVTVAKAMSSNQQVARLIDVLEMNVTCSQEIVGGVGIINYDNVDPDWTRSYLEELRFEYEEVSCAIDHAHHQALEDEDSDSDIDVNEE